VLLSASALSSVVALATNLCGFLEGVLGNTSTGECGCGRFVGRDSAAVGLPIEKTFLTSQQEAIEVFVVGPTLAVKSNPHCGKLCLHLFTMTSTSAGRFQKKTKKKQVPAHPASYHVKSICVCCSNSVYF
jgi:hypothetical protein